jgi:hypothetical protein
MTTAQLRRRWLRSTLAEFLRSFLTLPFIFLVAANEFSIVKCINGQISSASEHLTLPLSNEELPMKLPGAHRP